MAILPLVMTQQGLQPASPADLRARLVAMVAAIVPDYTSNLPSTLVEDIASTDVYALVVSDSFLVDLVNSITPFGANAFLLNQLGTLYGVDPQPITNTSVYVVFNGPPGYSIAQGFTVGDSVYQYICQDGGICGADGQTLPMYAVATTSGAWAIPPGTVTQLLTSVPSGITLTVTNPVAGVPSTAGESIATFRERAFTAGLAASTGMGRYLKTLVGNVPGVQSRLVAVQPEGDNFVVLVGGGDPYQVAYAIWQSDFYTQGLSGADILVAGINNDDPIMVTTANNHNLQDGDVIEISGVVGIPFVNDTPLQITVLGPKTFTIPLDGTMWGTYQYGGVITPNPINNAIVVTDYPDSYLINFVTPPQEYVSIVVYWETDISSYVSPNAMAQAAQPAIIDYINSLPAGIAPINLNVLDSLFLDAVKNILPGERIIDIQWVFSINGVGTLPDPGTQVIYGDPYSYFYTDSTQVSVQQG
jgi:hypothetical protein